MDVDPMEYAEQNDDNESGRSRGAARGRLNSLVAITVAMLATFMAVCRVKDDNIVQAMQQAQASQIDTWAWYQARNIRQEVAEDSAASLHAQALAYPPGAARTALLAQAARLSTAAAAQAQKKQDTRKSAEGAQKTYDALNYHDDQFDLSETALSLAIALFAITSLTQKRWLYGVALVPTAFGVVLGLAGLLGAHIHPDTLTRLLS